MVKIYSYDFIVNASVKLKCKAYRMYIEELMAAMMLSSLLLLCIFRSKRKFILKYLKFILIINIFSYELAFAQVDMNMNSKILSQSSYLNNYLYIIKEMILRADSQKFDKEDKVFGNLSMRVHKTNDYKVEKGLYKNIPNIDDAKIILSKNRNETLWRSMTLMGISDYFVDILPNCDEPFFTKELNLIKFRTDHDKDLRVYKYLYKTKNNTLIQFIVDEKQFNNESYPKNFQAIEVKWN